MLERLLKGYSSKDPYIWLGLGLTVAGACLSPIFFFIVDSIPLTGLAVSFVMLGMVCVTLANTRPPISPEASQMMLRAGMENTAALLEELGLTGKAVYLPHSRREGRSQALIPIHQDYASLRLDERISGRLIVRHGRNPRDVGIAVVTPGSVCLEGLELKPGPSSAEMESALSSILVGMLDVAASVSVNSIDNRVKVEISRPKLSYENIWYYQSLGSPLASIAATVASEALDRPIVIARDEIAGNKAIIELEVLR